MKTHLRIIFILFLLVSSVHSQTHPISLAHEARGGNLVLGLFEDSIKDAWLNPAYATNINFDLFFGGQLASYKYRDITPYIWGPINGSHAGLSKSIGSWTGGMYLNERLTYFQRGNSYTPTHYSRTRTGNVFANHNILPNLRMGVLFSLSQDISHSDNQTHEPTYLNTGPIIVGVHYMSYLTLWKFGLYYQPTSKLSIQPVLEIHTRKSPEYTNSYYIGNYPEEYHHSYYPKQSRSYNKYDILSTYDLKRYLQVRLVAMYFLSKYNTNSCDQSLWGSLGMYNIPEIYKFDNENHTQYEKSQFRLGVGVKYSVFNLIDLNLAITYSDTLSSSTSNSKSIKSDEIQYNSSHYLQYQASIYRLVFGMDINLSDSFRIIWSSYYWLSKCNYTERFMDSGEPWYQDQTDCGWCGDLNEYLRIGIESKITSRVSSLAYFKLRRAQMASDFFFQFKVSL
ncbi:hypothetical protein HQ585_07280 [candidate division KSB1 bacterium]|nr:hypothetical protein [candidate division KSB1 bacterium]